MFSHPPALKDTLLFPSFFKRRTLQERTDMRRENMRAVIGEGRGLHILGSPDSHLSCRHQQRAARTEEQQTSKPLNQGQFLIINPPSASHELCRSVYPPDQTTIHHLRNSMLLTIQPIYISWYRKIQNTTSHHFSPTAGDSNCIITVKPQPLKQLKP